ncbi:hypothetical protein D3C87_2136990 [compost metagenome]
MRQVGRAQRSAAQRRVGILLGTGVRRHEPLDDAVFQRVEADHHQAPSDLQQFIRRLQPSFEVLKLLIDVNP